MSMPTLSTVCFFPSLRRLLAWPNLTSWAGVPRQPSAWGVALVLWGGLQAVVGTLAQWIWVSRMAFLISLVGCLIALRGLQTVRELAYPLGTLVLMIAPPTFVFERITLPLQLLASR